MIARDSGSETSGTDSDEYFEEGEVPGRPARQSGRRRSLNGRHRSQAHWSAFLPNAWILKHTSDPFPYTPQIGDEVMYFKQGHRAYMDFAEAQELHGFKCVPGGLESEGGSHVKPTPS